MGDVQYIDFDEAVALIIQHTNKLVSMRADKNNIAVDDGIMYVSILGPALMALGTLVN